MHVRRVETPEDVELLRTIRNACREYMTYRTAEITPEEQASWWSSAKREAYLFDDVAFAYVSRRHKKTFITLGILPEARGKGLGTQVYRFVAALHPEVWAEVRHDNEPSINAAIKAGFETVLVDGNRVVMRS